MSTSENFTIHNETKAKLPRLAFESIKNAALGPDYELSLVIVSVDKIHELNRTTRNIDKPTDILSFPLSETEGEMFINPEYTAIEAKKFGRDYDNFFGYLFIHGLVHLKGHDHGSTMDSIEAELRAAFNI